MAEQHWIRTAAPATVLRAAAARGVDPAAILGDAGEGPLSEDEQLLIPLSRHFAIWSATMRRVDDPGFVVDVGASVSHEIFSVSGHAARAAPDLQGALRVMQRFGRLYANDTTFLSEEEPEGIRAFMLPSGPLPLAARCATENVMVQTVSLTRRLVGEDFCPLDVTFRHSAPRSVQRHREYFGITPRFEQPRTSLVFSTEDLTRPTLDGDPALHRLLVELAEGELERLESATSFTGAVQHAALRLLPTGEVTIAAVSRTLACAPRTLRRRLEGEGTSFQEVIDRVRRSLADRYLGQDQLSVEEVSVLLGYSDARAFRRAFRRWTGETPAQRRRRGVATSVP